MKLEAEDREIIERAEEKTKTALKLWGQRQGTKATGHALVEMLVEMGRKDAATEVENFLGKQSDSVKEASYLFTQIDDAARQGNDEKLNELIGTKGGDELDEEFKDMPLSPLHSAVWYNHFTTVQLLVHRGFDIHRTNSEGKKPIELADKNSYSGKAIFEFLSQQEGTRQRHPDSARARASATIQGQGSLESGPSKAPSPPTVQPDQNIARTALDEATYAKNHQLMKDLLNEKSIDVSIAVEKALLDKYTWAPLHTAAGQGDLEAVKILVDHNADLSKQNTEGYTAEDLARGRKHNDVSEYLARQRVCREQDKKEECKQLQKEVLGKAITVYLHGSPDCPSEFRVRSLNMESIMEDISQLLGVEVKLLKMKGTGSRIIQARDLLFTSDVVAVLEEAVELNFPTCPRDKAIGPVEEGQTAFKIEVQHFNTYWDKPPVKMEFQATDDFNAIIRRISKQLDLPVHGLYTSDKMSRIKQTEVLQTKHKNRVIAAAQDDPVNQESGPLKEPKFLDGPQSKEFNELGGTLFDWRHGVLIEVPRGAVAEGQTVKVTVGVTAVDRRMDLCNEWGKICPVGMPVFVQTVPNGYQFKQPIKLRFPHSGVYDTNMQPCNIIVLSAPVVTMHGSKGPFHFHRLQDHVHVDDNHVTVETLKFSSFWAFTDSRVQSRRCMVAIYSQTDKAARQANVCVPVKIAVLPNLHQYYAALRDEMTKSDSLVLRARKAVVVTTEKDVNIEIRNKGSDQWNMSVHKLGMPMHAVWNILYSNRPVRSTLTELQWAGHRDQKNKTPIYLEFSISDQGRSFHSSKLDMYVSLPEIADAEDSDKARDCTSCIHGCLSFYRCYLCRNL
jgi:ankyrin repeat protein